MNAKPVWLAAMSEYVPPLAMIAALGCGAWRPREKRRRKALQFVANSLCNIVATDRRYPNEVRRHHPEGGRLVLDILEHRCILNDSDVGAIGIVDRLASWFEAQLTAAQIPASRICSARVAVEYTAAERTYLASGRVWEMYFSLQSEVGTAEHSYVGASPSCTAAIPYGIGAIVAW
jgi:hypothetical protein